MSWTFHSPSRTLTSVIVADAGWPQLIWHSWWSLSFFAVVFLIRFAWVYFTTDPDEDDQTGREPPHPS
jgi:hypothetical protein